jgi:CRISPR-associated endonuclease Csn1
MNKKILGLDIGTTSIGWAIVEATKQKPLKDNQYFKGESPETKTDTNNQRTGLHYKDDLPAVGVRIISQGKMGSRFDTGKKLNEKKEKTPTKERRDFRSARKTKSRYKLRRDKLCIVLDALKMLPDDSYSNENEKKVWKPVEKKNNNWYTNDKGNRESDIGEALYKLRTDALNPENEISLKDWGRILLHLNQWRGYSSDRFSNNEDSEAEDGFYTSMVNDDVVEIKRTYKDRHNKKLDKIYYQLKFENGDIGVDVVKVGENSFYSRFKKGEVATYKKSYDDEDKNTTYFIWQNLKKEAWAYQKWLINDGIEKYLKENILASVGSYFYQKHYVEKSLSRIRTNTINRGWYEDEFDKIWKVQFERYKNKFTAEVVKQCIDAAFKKDESVKKELLKLPTLEKQLKALIRDKIIYYQRSWQQSKNKGECRFEKIPDIKKDKDNKTIPHKDGKDHWKGRTVIPRSHPLHQEFKLWQQINNVRIWFHSVNEKEIELMENETKCKDKLGKTPNQIKELLYERLQQKKEQSWRTFVNEIFPDINIKLKKATDKGTTKEKYFSVNYIKLSKKTTDEQDNLLKGNKTKVQIREILIDKSNEWFITNNAGVNKKREEKSNNENKRASCLVPISNFQLLWEIIYDITGFKAGNEKANIELITRKIRNHFDAETITDEQCVLLAKIKFDDSGMGNLSARAIRKMLPLMACSKYADQYPLNEKVKAQIEKLIILNQQEQNETNDELKLYSLKEFIPDKKARIKLSEKMSEDEFKGLNYWEAAAVVYGTHSKPGVINRTQDEIKEAVRNLLPVKPSSMNNPVVEKIVNETLKMVQLLYNTYGFDELRIELSRELKNSREEREAIWDAQNNNRKRNEFAKKMLREMFNDEDISELDLKTSNRNIEKIKIVEDVVGNLNPKKHAEKRKEYKISEPTKAEVKNYRIWLQQNFKCPYTNELIPFSDVFSKNDVIQREHIIPKERYPDNSYSNIVLTWKEVNNAKAENGNRTAFEFIDSKRDRETVNVSGKGDLKLVLKEQWEEHVHKMFGKGRKAKNLLRKSIPEDPVNREL